ncbi:MAG TPA: hypothetical protein DCZ94_09860 [Lentisphaeria bacterium]|nr:MAG: hypothetical protein A2X48_19100 [Lentisphaerae bacterium GWF2_49_21]HBC87248.1 hypothetical protein [Lentisphaeria bacterium]
MNKKYFISVFVLLAALSGVLAYYKYFPEPKLPDPKEQKPVEIAKLMASDDFSKLPEKVRDKYLENLVNQENTREIFYSSEGMTEDQKKNLRENMRAVFDLRTKITADEYFALPPDKREEYLDKKIDEMAERFAERRRNAEAQGGTGNMPGPGAWGPGGGQGGGPPGQGGSGGRRQGPTAQQVKSRIETTDPATRAKTAQYRKEMRERMQQRRSN